MRLRRIEHLRPGRGHARRATVLGLLSWALLLGASTDAFAHAAFLESQPAPGTRVEADPQAVVLRFTEPLNPRLSNVSIVEEGSGRAVRSTPGPATGREMSVRPGEPLPTGAYRVRWRAVSTQDGHPIEGSLSFGLRTEAAAGGQELEQSPLARGGWLRIAVRGIFYVSLFFFAGGLFNAVLLARREGPAGWLVPRALERNAEGDPSERAWARTLDAGWLAAGSAAAVALVEAADASGGFGLQGLTDYLLTNVAGLARTGAVVAVALATLLASRRRGAAAALAALAFLSISLSGHANSADARALAVATDWVHLIAAAVWAGGIAQIVACWLAVVRRAPQDLRRGVMRHVLDRFGRIAVPAFLLVVATGFTNALIQLGRPAAMWETPYGRVLAVKIGLVGLIALASYWHAVRLRPRVLASGAGSSSQRLERRHWRVLRAEPLGAVAVIAAAAALVAFPLPPRQLADADGAEASERSCDGCALKSASAAELAVAEQAGSSVVAAWIRRAPQGLEGTVRVLGLNQKPVEGAQIAGARTSRCGAGCLSFRTLGRPRELRVRVPERGRTYTARLPARWRGERNEAARALLVRAQRTMRRLASVRESEQITSGPGSRASVSYGLKAPDRVTFATDLGAESVTVGTQQWSRGERGMPWIRSRFAGGGPGFRTRTWFRWSAYARSVRLLDEGHSGGRRYVRLALMDPATPVWFRLSIDRKTMRVRRVRMIADGHFMRQRFARFNRPLIVEPPPLRDDD